jgi:spermidine synthase
VIRAAVLAIFILSGAAGLIYEIVWARQLVLVFGNTTQAVSAILTGFFGGMAIGSFVGGRLADRVRSPLRLYGWLEIALVFVVLATPITFQLLHEVYRGAYGALQGAPYLLALLRFALALLALGPATVMMGATLPALTRHLSRRSEPLSRAFGRLYAANTIGAILGTLVSGLVLIELLGLGGALLVGAACSAVAGVVALLLDRMVTRREVRAAEAAGPTTPAASTVGVPGSGPTLALAVAFVSGLTSLGYQVLWTRLLSSGTGGSTYVFTVILGFFLTGLAIGAIVYNLVGRRVGNPILLLAASQVAVAVLVVLGLVRVIAQPGEVNPFFPLQALDAVWQAAPRVVLPATIVMGLAFPAASALLATREGHVATAAGQLLAANTVGSISGTFLVPFVVIPAIGSANAVLLLAFVNLATAIALASTRLWVPIQRVAVTGTALAVALIVAVMLLSPLTLLDPAWARIRAMNGIITRSAEDEIASVQAGRLGSTAHLWVGGTSMTLLTVDARLMPILPLMARPEAQSALTVAFGMGSSYRTALIAGLSADAVELVPSVPEMFDEFYPDADAILSNPRGRIIVADGRNHVELTDRTYDIIVTDPPPPIESSGVSVIASHEYYQAGLERLNSGGIMMQWMPYGSAVEEFKAHLRSFADVFPEVLIAIGPGGYGFFLMGSELPMTLDEANIRTVLARPGVLEDISGAYDSPETTVDGWVRRIPGLVWRRTGQEVRAYVGPGPLITDDRPMPEYFFLRRVLGPPSPLVTPGNMDEFSSS